MYASPELHMKDRTVIFIYCIYENIGTQSPGAPFQRVHLPDYHDPQNHRRLYADDGPRLFDVRQRPGARLGQGPYRCRSQLPAVLADEPDGQFFSGFDIDIANALCAQMKADCTIVSQEWDGMMPALNAKKFDMIVASMSITEERKKSADFSDSDYDIPST